MTKLTPSALLSLLSCLPLFTSAQAVTHIVTETSTLPPITVTVAASSASLSPDYTNDHNFQFAILNSTNYFRYLYPAPYLTYNTTLASFAQSYSEKCTWSHNPSLAEHGYGENLAMGYAAPSAAVDAWGNEAALFNFDVDDYTGFTEETGHFTQLVWRSTGSVGCGWRDCGSGYGNDRKAKRDGDVEGIMLVCNYYPAGNIMSSTDDENMFFKENVVPERRGGANGFNAEDAGMGVGGPSGTATESVPGTVTASAGAVKVRVGGVWGGDGWRGTLGSAAAVGIGLAVGGAVL